ncbi:hypothetical protein ACWCPF_37570 [Streptomyces sp. NPDC001858]
MAWVSEELLIHADWRRDLLLLAAPGGQANVVDGMSKRPAELLDDSELLARYRAAMDAPAQEGHGLLTGVPVVLNTSARMRCVPLRLAGRCGTRSAGSYRYQYFTPRWLEHVPRKWAL